MEYKSKSHIQNKSLGSTVICNRFSVAESLMSCSWDVFYLDPKRLYMWRLPPLTAAIMNPSQWLENGMLDLVQLNMR